ncbi:MAG: GAF domain-containing protein [Dysgonomonas sp.]
MSDSLKIQDNLSKEEKYKLLYPQIKSLTDGESDSIANMANISAALKMTFRFLWVGFYIVKHNELVLGPFQGDIACTRIKYGKGVCGTAWKEKRTVIVPNVNHFEGHIACSEYSLSEIVVPIFYHDQIIAVLDVDSEFENHFDKTDSLYLQQIVKLIS